MSKFSKEVSFHVLGDHYKPDFVKKNPFHKVPIIIDDGVMISERYEFCVIIKLSRIMGKQCGFLTGPTQTELY